jgi:hypothetical protein
MRDRSVFPGGRGATEKMFKKVEKLFDIGVEI